MFSQLKAMLNSLKQEPAYQKLLRQWEQRVEVVKTLYPTCCDAGLHDITKALIDNKPCKNCTGDCPKNPKFFTLFDIWVGQAGEPHIIYTECKRHPKYRKYEYTPEEQWYIDKQVAARQRELQYHEQDD